MPDKNVIIFTVGTVKNNGQTVPCVTVSEEITKLKLSEHDKLVLEPASSNQQPVTLFFDDSMPSAFDTAADVFEDPPAGQVHLLPKTVSSDDLSPEPVDRLVLRLRRDIPGEVSYRFDIDPDVRCRSTDHADVIVEC